MPIRYIVATPRELLNDLISDYLFLYGTADDTAEKKLSKHIAQFMIDRIRSGHSVPDWPQIWHHIKQRPIDPEDFPRHPPPSPI